MRRGELQFLGRLALRLPCSINVRAADVHLCQIGSTSEVSMKNQRLFDTAREIASRDVAQIATLIEKLTRSIATLSIDIEHEEERAQVRDVFDSAYPILARSLAARRDNLRATVAALEALVGSGDHDSRDVHFVSGLMAHTVPFRVAELGARR
jgi:hypothetical protein